MFVVYNPQPKSPHLIKEFVGLTVSIDEDMEDGTYGVSSYDVNGYLQRWTADVADLDGFDGV